MTDHIDILDFLEEVAAYPDTPDGLSAAAEALEPAIVWSRIYSWIAWRWGTTVAEWKAVGCGEFVLPLTPATVTLAAYWSEQAGDWIEITPKAGPRGVVVPAHSTWRITATCGGDESAPAAVEEAYRRLAEFMVSGNQAAFATSISSGDLSLRFRPDHAARALQYSGAADLLRPYRRLGRD